MLNTPHAVLVAAADERGGQLDLVLAAREVGHVERAGQVPLGVVVEVAEVEPLLAIAGDGPAEMSRPTVT
jgi:hypothetical protein